MNLNESFMNQPLKDPTRIILIILVFVLVAILGFSLGYNQGNMLNNAKIADNITPSPSVDSLATRPDVTNSPNDTKTNTTPPATDETADWKTYSNVEHGFSLKYPSNFYTNELKGLSEFTSKSLIVRVANYQYTGDINKGTDINSIPELKKLDHLINFPVLDTLTDYKTYRSSQQQYLIKKENKNIGGLDITTEYYRNPEEGLDSKSETVKQLAAYWKDKNGKELFISNIGEEGSIKEEDQTILLNIINSLKKI